MSFTRTVGLAYGQEKQTSTAKRMPLGTRGVLPDGRVFYYALNGAAALEAGKCVQTKVAHGASGHANGLDVVNATATGVTTLTITLASTNAARDLYADGYVTVDTTPGVGMWKIQSHAAIASGANGEFNFYDDDKIVDPMTSGTTKVGLRENEYASVVVAPTTATGAVVGVTVVPVAAASYFWAQTYGPGIVDCDTAPVAGQPVVSPGGTAGNVFAATTAAALELSQPIGIGWTAASAADTVHALFLTIRA